jgi:hypothetical protein
MFVVLMDVVTERSFNWVQRDTLLKLSRTGQQDSWMTETTSPIGTGLVLKSSGVEPVNSVGKEQDLHITDESK